MKNGSLTIKNGIVFDPINRIKGEKKDIYIVDGRISEKPDKDAKVIDATNRLVYPGGIDIHSHFAGGKETAGRLFRPEDGARVLYPKKDGLRSGSGFSMPSCYAVGYIYARMGYTTAFTPAMPPLFARHTHEELGDVPIIDKAAYPTYDGNWFAMKYIKEKDRALLAASIAWFLNATKGFVVKLVNPGGTENWGWGKNILNVKDKVVHFDITAEEMIKSFAEANEALDLPHSIHIHPNNLGRPGNYETTIKTLKLAEHLQNKERQSIYLTHAQFHSYGGDSWKNFSSKADELANYVNSHSHVALDTGNVTLDETTTMTSDGPMEYFLSSLTHLKWVNKNVELETAPGVTPYIYSRKSPVSVVQWAAGLELALLIKDTWKALLATDHPNGGPFTRYPRIISWLMSRECREKEMQTMHKAVEKNAIIATLDREYDFNEIAIVTRAGQAKALRLKEKGHLGAGASGDVAIYDINPLEINPSREYEKIEKAFSGTYCTIKDGEIVAKAGEIVSSPLGKTYWSNVSLNHEISSELNKELEYYFKRFYSVNLANYPVQLEYIERNAPLKINAHHLSG